MLHALWGAPQRWVSIGEDRMRLSGHDAKARHDGDADYGDQCELCDGTGEVDAALIQDMGCICCPECIAFEKDLIIAELERALYAALNGVEIVIPDDGLRDLEWKTLDGGERMVRRRYVKA